MPQSINTNLISLNAQRNLSSSQSSLAVSMQRLSSGLRVNSAKDDAAGLAIAERMNTQIKGMTVGIRNANDGISLSQTAEGALGKVGDALQRMRELAVQARNSTNSDADKTSLDKEFGQLAQEIQRVLGGTTFNGKHILGTDSGTQTFQVQKWPAGNFGPGNRDWRKIQARPRPQHVRKAHRLQIVVLIHGFAQRGHQAAFGHQAGVRADTLANAIPARHFAGEKLEGGHLVAALLGFLLKLLVTVAHGVQVRPEIIVVGDLPGHPHVAGGHADQREETKQRESHEPVEQRVRYMDAAQAPVQRVGDYDNEIGLLQFPTFPL